MAQLSVNQKPTSDQDFALDADDGIRREGKENSAIPGDFNWAKKLAANAADFNLATISAAQLITQNAAAKVEDPDIADLTAIAIAQGFTAGRPLVYTSPFPKDYEYRIYTSGSTIALRPVDADDLPRYVGDDQPARPSAADFNAGTEINWYQKDISIEHFLESDGTDWLDKTVPGGAPGSWGVTESNQQITNRTQQTHDPLSTDPSAGVAVQEAVDAAILTHAVATKADLQALPVIKAAPVVKVADAMSCTDWVIEAGDLSAQVAADPRRGRYIPVQGDPTGASGAWRAKFKDLPLIEWWIDGRSDYGLAFADMVNTGITAFTSNQEQIEFLTPINPGPMSDAISKVFYLPATELINNSPDGLFVGDSYRRSKIDIMRITQRNGAGHIFNHIGTVSKSEWNIDFVDLTNSTDQSFWYGRPADGGTGKPNTLVIGLELKIYEIRCATRGFDPKTGPKFFDHSSEDITWRDVNILIDFMYGPSNNYCFDIQCYHQSNGQNANNSYIVKAAECCTGGLIKLTGEINSDIDMVLYDVEGLTQNVDAIVLGTTTAAESGSASDGANCKRIDVKFQRFGGDNGAFYDLNLGTSDNTHMDLISHSTSSAKKIHVNVNNRPAKSANDENVVYYNEGTLLVKQQETIVPQGVAKQVIQNGEVTIPGNSPVVTIRVDGEGNVADEITKFNGGIANQIIFVKSFAGTRPITIKHGTANITMPGGADVLLSHTRDVAMFVCFTPGQVVHMAFSDNL